MKHEKQFFPLSFIALLITIVFSASQTNTYRSGSSTQYNLLYSSAEAALRPAVPSKKGTLSIKQKSFFPVTEGKASFYADQFHGRKTANGETFNMGMLTAAHPSLPFGTLVRVTNLRNGKDVIVRINDRGPFVKGRIIDLSISAAKEIGLIKSGTARVKLEALSSNRFASISG
jgi:rare lipoprotein A